VFDATKDILLGMRHKEYSRVTCIRGNTRNTVVQKCVAMMIAQPCDLIRSWDVLPHLR